jgi:acetoacetyl-CoA synthetase
MAKLLWKPTQAQIEKTNMYRFMNFINDTYKQNFKEYAPLYDWSIENISDFLAAFWKFAGVIHCSVIGMIRWR